MPIPPMMLQNFEILAAFTDMELAKVVELCREENHDKGTNLFA